LGGKIGHGYLDGEAPLELTKRDGAMEQCLMSRSRIAQMTMFRSLDVLFKAVKSNPPRHA